MCDFSSKKRNIPAISLDMKEFKSMMNKVDVTSERKVVHEELNTLRLNGIAASENRLFLEYNKTLHQYPWQCSLKT